MSAPKSVLGVSSVCRVGFGDPAQFKTFVSKGLRAVCWVCWVWCRVRACMMLFAAKIEGGNFSYARTEKPNKPNTHNTDKLKLLILKGFICVEFVSSSGFSVLGSVFRGEGR